MINDKTKSRIRQFFELRGVEEPTSLLLRHVTTNMNTTHAERMSTVSALREVILEVKGSTSDKDISLECDVSLDLVDTYEKSQRSV